MDSENQPSTSKQAKENKEQQKYPVTIEEFKKFTNVEEYVLEQMERAGPEIYRINYKIRHKYHATVYKQFYANQTLRAKMLRTGLALKPVPKFLKEKFMEMPGIEAEVCTTIKHKHRDKPIASDSKVRFSPDVHQKVHRLVNSTNKIGEENNNEKQNRKSLEKENSAASTNMKSSPRFASKNDRIRGKPLAVESRKITNFFTALKLEKVSIDSKPNSKRKADLATERAEMEPQIKKIKDAGSFGFGVVPKSRDIHKSSQKTKNRPKLTSELVSASSDTESNIKIDVAEPINIEKQKAIKSPEKMTENRKTTIYKESNQAKKCLGRNTNENDKKEKKRSGNKHKGKSKTACLSDDIVSDDADIQSSVEEIDLTKPSQVCVLKSPKGNVGIPQSPITSPLLRRNRTEDFKKPSGSLQKKEIRKQAKEQERNQSGDSDADMELLSLSGLSSGKMRNTKDEIEDWIENGLKALKENNDVAENTTEYEIEENKVFHMLKAINLYPEGVIKWISYTINLEKQKQKGTERAVVRSEAMISLRAHSSDSRSTQQSINRAKVDEVNIPDEHISKDVGYLENLNCTTLKKRLAPEESQKRNGECSERKAMQIEVEGVDADLEKSFHNDDQIDKLLDEIFEEAGLQQSVPTSSLDKDNQMQQSSEESVPKDIKVIENAVTTDLLSKTFERPDERIINEPLGSPGQLISTIIQPAHSISIKSLIKVTNTQTDPVLESQDVSGVILPSPNLFQSSEESNFISSKSQGIEMQPPETVYVHCNHSMISNTEQSNFTVLSIKQTDINFDPFAEKSTNKQDTVVNEMNVTMLPTPNANVVVKHEPLFTTAVSEDDNSVIFIDIPPSEPIVIEDEETTPELLNMLLSNPIKHTKPKSPSIVNRTHLPSTSCLNNFPQAQRLPSNFSFIQSQLNLTQSNITQTHDVTPMPQTSSVEKSKESVEFAEVIDLRRRSDSIECTQYNLKAATESSTTNIEIESLINLIKTDSQESNAPLGNEHLKSPRSTKRPTKKSSKKPCDLSKELLNSGSASEVISSIEPAEQSYVSIAPQRIPSEIELTQSSSKKSSNQIMKSKEADMVSTFVREEQSTAECISEAALMANVPTSRKIVDQQTLKCTRIGENFDKSTNNTQESLVSVSVCVTQDDDFNEAISKDVELLKHSATEKGDSQDSSRNIEETGSTAESFIEIDNSEVAADVVEKSTGEIFMGVDDGKVANEEVYLPTKIQSARNTSQFENPVDDKSSNDVAQSGTESQEPFLGNRNSEIVASNSNNVVLSQNSQVDNAELSKTIAHADTLQESFQGVLLLQNGNEEENLNIQEEEEVAFHDILENKSKNKSKLTILYANISKGSNAEIEVLEESEEDELYNEIRDGEVLAKHYEGPGASQQNAVFVYETNRKKLSPSVLIEGVPFHGSQEHEPIEIGGAENMESREQSHSVDSSGEVELLEETEDDSEPSYKIEDADISNKIALANNTTSQVTDQILVPDNEFKRNKRCDSIAICIPKSGSQEIELMTFREKGDTELPAIVQCTEFSDGVPIRGFQEIELMKINRVENRVPQAQSADSSGEVELLEETEDDLELSYEGADISNKIVLANNMVSQVTGQILVSDNDSKRNKRRDSTAMGAPKSSQIIEQMTFGEKETTELPAIVQRTKDMSKDVVWTCDEQCLGCTNRMIASIVEHQQSHAGLDERERVESYGKKYENVNTLTKNSSDEDLPTSESENIPNVSTPCVLNEHLLRVPHENRTQTFEDAEVIADFNQHSHDAIVQDRMEVSYIRNTKVLATLSSGTSSDGTKQDRINTSFGTGTKKLQDTVPQEMREAVMQRTETSQSILETIPKTEKIISKELAKAVEPAEVVFCKGAKNQQQSELLFASQTTTDHEVASDTAQQLMFSEVFCVTEEPMSGPEEIVCTMQQSVIAEQSTATHIASSKIPKQKERVLVIPALFPLGAFQIEKTKEIIETSADTAESAHESEIGELIEVPFLIHRKFINSLPFNMVSPEQIQEADIESEIYAIDVKLEFKLSEPCVSLSPKHGQIHTSKPVITAQEKLLSSTTHHKFDKKAMRDGVREAVSSDASVPEATLNKNKSQKIIFKPQNTNAVYPNCSNSPTPPDQAQKVSLKPKPLSKRKKKLITPKKSLNNLSNLDFVPQKTHTFRSLPLGVTKKSTPNCELNFKQPTLTTVEDIDYLIEDGSQVTASSTASQILGSDCTYFEGSQLLRNIEDQCVPGQPSIPINEQHQLKEPKVNNFNSITMSEGIMARKIWKVHLQWKTNETMAIEIRFVVGRRWLTVCDESAKLLFNYSPATWSNIFRVLRQIDNFEYKLKILKNCQTTTLLHKLLQSLFDSAPRIVNVKLIDDSFNPYATCEKAKNKYKGPFQCLTKGIPANVLIRMKALKENLRINNSE